MTRNIYRLFLAFGALLAFVAAFLRTWGTSYLRVEVMRDPRIRTVDMLAIRFIWPISSWPWESA